MTFPYIVHIMVTYCTPYLVDISRWRLSVKVIFGFVGCFGLQLLHEFRTLFGCNLSDHLPLYVHFMVTWAIFGH